ncbi:hypothetical protein VE03_04578 [Pseudogymnoascus sp. 23342-1-I1]|nr:hypothetical protein VE03_04578 [Pseudogymnoascus sp. 23342-1-I1]
MSSSARDPKRKNDDREDKPISPPPIKRKVQSTTTKNAVSSFFKPTSQKPPEPITWSERAVNEDTPTSLVVGKYVPPGTSKDAPPTFLKKKIAAFDLDSTLVSSVSGKKFVFDAGDWKWWNPNVPLLLRKLHHEEGFTVVIISNQGAINLHPDRKAPTAHRGRLEQWKGKISSILRQLDIPTTLYAATGFDNYRKPRTGMWDEILEDYGLSPETVDMKESFFVGDAAGRVAGRGVKEDFADTDRGFGDNVGIRFLTPEEYFLDEKPREYARSFHPGEYVNKGPANDAVVPPFVKSSEKEIILFTGSPASGKSTFYHTYLHPLGYLRINQDLLKTRDKCLKTARLALEEGKSVAIDATNPDEATRAHWVALAREMGVEIRGVLFLAGRGVCRHNDVVRALNEEMNPEKRAILPNIAFTSFNSKYKPPTLEEGFKEIMEVKFQFQGTEEEEKIWTRYWT